MPMSLCVFLEGEPGSCPKAVLWFLDYSFLCKSSPFPNQQLPEPAPWTSWKAVEADKK